MLFRLARQEGGVISKVTIVKLDKGDKVKKGIVTSEFYIVVAQAVSAIGIALGFLTVEDAGALEQAAVAIGAFVASVIVVVQYVKSRTALKLQANGK